jgi:hypothetical protein
MAWDSGAGQIPVSQRRGEAGGGVPRRRSQAAGNRRWQARGEVEVAGEGVGRHRAVEAKLVAATASPDGGRRWRSAWRCSCPEGNR